MHRFYCPNTNFDSLNAIISEKDELHHLRDVLRLRVNDSITLFNGSNQEATGIISEISTQQVIITLQTIQESKPPIPSFILACAIPKKGKFETIIEKATELGVNEIIPMNTHRTEFHLNSERLKKKHARYQSIAINAAKQSQRVSVPIIHPITKFEESLKLLTTDTTIFIPSLPGKREHFLTVLNQKKASQRVAFLIGPEGDFTTEEYDLANNSGCIAVSLGETILKVETAAITVMAGAALTYR